MKRIALCLLWCGLAVIPAASAQDHMAVAAYADYFHLSQTNTNFGDWGRFGFGWAPRALEPRWLRLQPVFTRIFFCFGGATAHTTDEHALP